MSTYWNVRGVFISKSIPFVIMFTVVLLAITFHFNRIFRIASREQDVSPMCTNGILDGIQYSSEQTHRGFLSVRQRQSCRLHHYKLEDTVSCLDGLSASKNDDNSSLALVKNGRRNKFHIAFVGDSRVRILYLSFIKVKSNFLSYYITIIRSAIIVCYY
jgi:hypothetical protein